MSCAVYRVVKYDPDAEDYFPTGVFFTVAPDEIVSNRLIDTVMLHYKLPYKQAFDLVADGTFSRMWAYNGIESVIKKRGKINEIRFIHQEE